MTPEGLYRGKITNQGLGKANTGTYQFQLGILVTEVAKDHDDVSAGFKPLDKPIKKTIFLPITQNTKQGVLADLQFLGYDRKTISSAALIPGSPASFEFKDKVAVVQCRHDSWNGKDREKWSICRRKAAAAMSREDVTQFDALFANEEEETDLSNVPL